MAVADAIEIRNLEKKFPQFKLGPLDLTVPQGAVYGLIGPNGAGKTTTINLIMGMGEKDAGCLAAALQVRLSRWAVQINLLLFAFSSMTMLALSTLIHEQPAIVDASLRRILLPAFPLCMLAGFFAIRRAIQLTSAGVYRDFFLEKLAP